MSNRLINISLCVLAVVLLTSFSAIASADTPSADSPEQAARLLQQFENIVADPEARQKANAQGQERAQFCFRCHGKR